MGHSAGQVKIVGGGGGGGGGGEVAFIFKLPVGQVELSGLFLTLQLEKFEFYSRSGKCLGNMKNGRGNLKINHSYLEAALVLPFIYRFPRARLVNLLCAKLLLCHRFG